MFVFVSNVSANTIVNCP